MHFRSTCCDAIKSQLEYRCNMHGDNCPDQGIRLSTLSAGLDVGGVEDVFLLIAPNAEYGINFCPFCGKNLKLNCIKDE